ncbi:uncharacterized protein [Amphiura filiformis]|uniref:uncharacterized protein n=1 Tax=Amphiura filiformis TaxID=82378 RepID=UPI003B21C7A6
MVVNFQSINNKVAELAICLDTHKPDILIGTESWLAEGVSNSEIFPTGYSVVRKDRPTGNNDRSHGGIFIAMRSDLIASHRIDLDEQCEILWVQLEIVGSKSVLIGAFYRPPDSGGDILDHLHTSLAKIDMSKGHTIWLGGDFNLSHIDWEAQSIMSKCPKPGLCRNLIDITNEFGLEQIVRKPTRGNNILDLFFTSNSTLVEKSVVVPGMSDHNGIPLVTVHTKPVINKAKPRKVFSYHKANWDSIKMTSQSLAMTSVKLSPV